MAMLSVGLAGVVVMLLSGDDAPETPRIGYDLPESSAPRMSPKPLRPDDGTFVAGVDWEAGEWASNGGKACRWEVREGREVTASGEKYAVVIELIEGQSLSTNGCGRWRPVESK